MSTVAPTPNSPSSPLHSAVQVPGSSASHQFPPSSLHSPSLADHAEHSALGNGEVEEGETAVDEFSVLKEVVGLRSSRASGVLEVSGSSGPEVLDEKENSPFERRRSYQQNAPSPILTATFRAGLPAVAISGDVHSPPAAMSNPASAAATSPENPISNASSRNPLAPTAPRPLSGASSNPAYRNDDEGEEIFGTPPKRIVGKHKPRAVVRVERDYSAGGSTTGRVQFWDGWVEELEGRITPLQFQNTLNEFNAILASAYDPYKSIFDNTLAVLTFYLSPYVIGTHYRRQMRRFAEVIERENAMVYNPAGLHLLHPRKVAFLFLEIEYY